MLGSTWAWESLCAWVLFSPVLVNYWTCCFSTDNCTTDWYLLLCCYLDINNLSVKLLVCCLLPYRNATQQGHLNPSGQDSPPTPELGQLLRHWDLPGLSVQSKPQDNCHSVQLNGLPRNGTHYLSPVLSPGLFAEGCTTGFSGFFSDIQSFS